LPIVIRIELGSNVTDVSVLHNLNTALPIDVTDFGIDIVGIIVPWNASLSIVVRIEIGSNVTDVSVLHNLNAEIPIDVTVFGIVIFIKLVS
jgi:hypothetical protein